MSSQPWNEFNLPQPPVVTIAVKNSSLNLSSLQKTLNDAIVCYESQKDLDEAAAFCSRILARRNNSFHNLKGYKDLRKVNVALCRLLRLNIVSVLNTFNGNLPDFMKTEGYKTELPSRECFDYLLLRMIALQKLYLRITECCLTSASYFIKVMRKNFFFDIITVFLSTIAKIWKISRENANKTAKFYNDLSKYRLEFPLKKEELCESFSFDELEIEPINTSKPINKKLIEFSESNDIQTVELIENKVKSHPMISIKRDSSTEPNSSSAIKRQKLDEVDVGVEITRESLSNEHKSTKNLKTLENILNFIKEESENRKRSLSDCQTKNVPEKSWKIFRKKISKLPGNDNRSAMKLVKKFLGNI